MTNKLGVWAYVAPIFYVAPTLMAMHATPVIAQIVRPPPQAEISRQRIQPLPLPETPLQLRIQNPEKASVPKAVDEIEFSITRIKVTGATHFPEERWRAIFAPLEGQKIVLSDLRDAASKLEDLYRAEGFFLTRVFIAPQEVRDGTLEVQVVEGFLANAFVQAPNDPSRKLTQAMITPVLDQRPVRFLDLEQRLLLLNDIPGMAVTSVLRPGGTLGSSDILLTAVKPPRTAFAAVDNSGSDVVGPINYSIGTTIFQPFGRPGALDMSLAMSGEGFRELQAISGRYATPLGNDGVVGSIGALVAHAAPGGPIRDLDVQSLSGSLSASLRVPLLRSRANSIYLDAGMTLNRSFVKALGTEINDDRSTVASLGLQWRQIGWLAGDMTFGVNLLHGVDLFGVAHSRQVVALAGDGQDARAMPPGLQPVEGERADVGIGQPNRLDAGQVGLGGIDHAKGAGRRRAAHHLHDRPAAVAPAGQGQLRRVDIGAGRNALDRRQDVAHPLIAPERQAGADRRQGEGPTPAARAVGIDDEGAPAPRLGDFGIAGQMVTQAAAAVEQQHRRPGPVVVGAYDGDVGFEAGPAALQVVHSRVTPQLAVESQSKNQALNRRSAA